MLRAMLRQQAHFTAQRRRSVRHFVLNQIIIILTICHAPAPSHMMFNIQALLLNVTEHTHKSHLDGIGQNALLHSNLR